MFMAYCLACTHLNEESADSTILLMIFWELYTQTHLEPCRYRRDMFRVSNIFHVLKKKEQRHELPNGDAEKLHKLGLSVFISLHTLDCGRQQYSCAWQYDHLRKAEAYVVGNKCFGGNKCRVLTPPRWNLFLAVLR